MSPPRHRPEADDASTDAPLRVSDGRWFSFTGGLVVGIVVVAVGAGLLYGRLDSRDDRASEGIATNSKRLDDHEARVRAVEGDVREMKAWVKDLHDWMASDRGYKAGKPTASNP